MEKTVIGNKETLVSALMSPQIKTSRETSDADLIPVCLHFPHLWNEEVEVCDYECPHLF